MKRVKIIYEMYTGLLSKKRDRSLKKKGKKSLACAKGVGDRGQWPLIFQNGSREMNYSGELRIK